jgi:tubulin beta
MDKVRREVESCDSLQGFQITHGIAGGTGGGITCNFLDNLRIEYPDNIIYTVSVLHNTASVSLQHTFPCLSKSQKDPTIRTIPL